MSGTWIPLTATSTCMLASIRWANEFSQKRPRLFTALGLFALSWGLLLPYYSNVPTETELLPAFSGFLMVYVGILLQRESDDVEAASTAKVLGRRDQCALWLLSLMILPSFFSFAPTEVWIPRIEVIVGTVLTLLGFYSILSALKSLDRGPGGAGAPPRNYVWTVLAVVLVAYAICEVGFTYHYLRSGVGMPDDFKIVFSVAKCVFTGLFLASILRYLLRKDSDLRKEYEESKWGLVLRIVHLP